MSSSRITSGSRRGRQSSDEARTTSDGGITREGQYAWKDKNCQVMLELVITELKADDYRSRLPDVAARKRIETKYFELVGEKVSWDVTPGRDALRFVNRKGTTSLNVLAMCDHDMLFTYCFVGMPGSTHDSRVLETAMRDDPLFPIPSEGKYYYVDSGYENRRGYLAPYRKERKEGNRYHLQEFLNTEPPKNSKEMFNRWHASLRSVIERTFGVWKQKWKVLNMDPRYDIATQRSVIFATMGLHNFIRWNKIKDTDFEEFEMRRNTGVHMYPNENNHPDEENEVQMNEGTSSGAYMKIVRDRIAEQMWSTKRHASRRQ